MKAIKFTSRQVLKNKVTYRNYLLAPIENSYYLYELDENDKIKSTYLVEYEGYKSLFDCFTELKRYYHIVNHHILIGKNQEDILGEFI